MLGRWYAHPAVLCGLALVSYLLPFVHHWGAVGRFDFDQYATFNRIALWWHTLGDPSTTWNPFMCGGATLVGNPQIPLYHPNIVVYGLFGPVNGLVVSIIPWGAFGFWGMWKLGRKHGLGRDVAGWIATAWVLNGFFIGQLGNMHAQYTAFFTLPVLFWLNERIAERADRWAMAGPGAFIGSNTALVAPIRIGDGVYVGSGSVLSKDVPADALVLTRSPLDQREGWAARMRARHGRGKGNKK